MFYLHVSAAASRLCCYIFPATALLLQSLLICFGFSAWLLQFILQVSFFSVMDGYSRKGEIGLFRMEDSGFPCGTSLERLLTNCLSLGSSASRYDDGDDRSVEHDDRSSQISGCCSVVNDGVKRERPNHSPPFCLIVWRRLLQCPMICLF
ncbi:hypothetical protein V6Z11_A05G350400 [Gossypium hirsutum]